MAKRGQSPLPGRGRPIEHGGSYNWVNSWAHGGSQMWGAASPSKKRKLKSSERGPAILALALIGGTILFVAVGAIIELF